MTLTSSGPALHLQCPERFESLLMLLQSQSPPPLKSLLTALINVVAESTDHFVLLLDDYQVITEEQVHATLAYLIEHLPAQLRLILSTFLCGYAMLLRLCLSSKDLDAACLALQQFERICMTMNQPASFCCRSLFTTVDQVRLWLACGELDRAMRWAEELDLKERHSPPFVHEREEVARARILLAKNQPALALQQLEPVLQRTTAGQRWGHVIETRLLQALAYQMCQEEPQALGTLSEAVRLAEPEGYIRSFVDEGAAMEALLYRLRRRSRQHGPTPYLDTLLAAFQQETKTSAQGMRQINLTV